MVPQLPSPGNLTFCFRCIIGNWASIMVCTYNKTYKIRLFSGFSDIPEICPRKVLALNRIDVESQTDIAGLDDLLSWSHTYKNCDCAISAQLPLIIPEELPILYAEEVDFDVNECIFCQGSENKKGRPLVTLGEDGIKSLEKTLPEFKNLKSEGYVFPGLMVEGRLLTDDPGRFLRSGTFKYHKYCKNKFNPSELQRAKKRRIDSSSVSSSILEPELVDEGDKSLPSDRQTRSIASSPGHPQRFSKICMFCNEAEEVKYNSKLSKTFKFKLRAAASKSKDAKYAVKFTEDIVNKANRMIMLDNAKHLNMYMLIAKLGTSDARASELYYHAQCFNAFNKR